MSRCGRERARPAWRRGFTLVELLTVIAIVAVLLAILIPTVNSVRLAANKAKTRALFGQWTAAIDAFKNEYGYYPRFDSSGLVNPPGQSPAPSTLHLFHDVIAGRRRDGSALPPLMAGASFAPEAQNRKRIAFRAFAESEFTEEDLLHDGNGGTEIAVVVDRTLDGVIDADDLSGGLPLVAGMRPTAEDFPSTGVRAGVIFYAPASGGSPDSPAFVFSWK